MRPIKIIADSTCDLSLAFLKQNEITILPLGVNFFEESYRDGIDLNVEELYKKVGQFNSLPKTSALSVGEIFTAFEEWIQKGYDILFVSISSKFSSVYQNACIAKENWQERVYIHDSYNLSTGIGLQIRKAVLWREEGKSLLEIVSMLQTIVPLVRAQFAVETLDYLYKGGRCSSLAYFFGRGLKLKPIIQVRDGGMAVIKKPRGKMINALQELLAIFDADFANMDLDCIMLTHSLAEESKKYLWDELSKRIDPKRIMLTDAGCVISSHCGKGTIGILYILKQKECN